MVASKHRALPLPNPSSGDYVSPGLELWGGVECTLNRVGDRQFDQLARGGHASRIEDLARFAALGIRTLRYPILWERTAPNGPQRADWRWADERLTALRALGIRPIAGLVHHGSGPLWTNLLDPAFPDGLAAFAGAVAARYPWISDYTPVNEPLTTARFSALYGYWYPHRSDSRACIEALLTQCRATTRAMQAIRRARPDARLVQTEDLGQTFSTPALAYQAEFENERRWLSFDMLCGRVGPGHALWDYLRWLGFDEGDVAEFQDHPCPPDLIGVNSYLTSDRFLDERLERYPAHTHGGNGRDRYADVEAVRVHANGGDGPARVLRAAWERYRIPLAVTEAHLSCTRDEQLRWFIQVWEDAGSLRGEGIDIQAVTAWSLLGAFDWNSLLTRNGDHYEPGAFDLRAPEPRPTAIATMLRDLATTGTHTHPVLATPGWWRRSKRLLYPVHPAKSGAQDPARARARPILLVMGEEALVKLGAEFGRACAGRGLPVRQVTRSWRSLGIPPLPWAVINLRPAWSQDAGNELAAHCAEHALPLLTFSTDLAVAGSGTGTYDEDALSLPLGDAGARAVATEKAWRSVHPGALIVRFGLLFGPWGIAGAEVSERAELARTAVLADDLAQTCLDLLIDDERGLWHLGHSDTPIAPRELAERIGAPGRFAPVEAEGEPSAAIRLTSCRGWPLGALAEALDRGLGPRPPLRELGVEAEPERPHRVEALG